MSQLYPHHLHRLRLRGHLMMGRTIRRSPESSRIFVLLQPGKLYSDLHQLFVWHNPNN